MGHQVVVLGDRESNASDVGFLKCIGADQFAAHLTGNTNDRRRIHHRRGNASHHVGGPRAGGGHGNSHLSTGACVAVRHVGGALLMAHQHVMNAAVLQGIVSRQDCASRISEDVGHAFPLQAFPKNLCSGLRHCHESRLLASPCARAWLAIILPTSSLPAARLPAHCSFRKSRHARPRWRAMDAALALKPIGWSCHCCLQQPQARFPRQYAGRHAPCAFSR